MRFALVILFVVLFALVASLGVLMAGHIMGEGPCPMAASWGSGCVIMTDIWQLSHHLSGWFGFLNVLTVLIGVLILKLIVLNRDTGQEEFLSGWSGLILKKNKERGKVLNFLKFFDWLVTTRRSEGLPAFDF